MNIKPFVIENGGNTNYISSVLFALFCNRSNINLLDKQLSIEVMILQEAIKHNLINKYITYKSITSRNINNIRYISLKNGWKSDKDILDTHNPLEYYYFIISKLNELITVNFPNKTTRHMPYKMFNISHDTDIKTLFKNWIQTNNISFKLNNTTNIYIHPPTLFSIHLNRSSKDIKVDIKKRIKHDNYLWKFYSLIGYKNNHYYVVYKYYSKWYMIDDTYIPSVININISDTEIQECLLKEAILVLYKMDM